VLSLGREEIAWPQQQENSNQSKPNLVWSDLMPGVEGGAGTGAGLQGTNQVNSNIFSSSGGGLFPLHPAPPLSAPPLQLGAPPPHLGTAPPPSFQFFSPWAAPPFYTAPGPSQAFLYPAPAFLPPGIPPPPFQDITRQQPGNGRPVDLGIDDKELQESKGFDLRVLFDLDSSPARLEWVARYLEFQAGQGDPVLVCPAMYREPLDLYKLYNAVREEGGFNNCTVKKAWKNISPQMTPNFRQPVLWRLLQKQYRRYLLKFEQADRAGQAGKQQVRPGQEGLQAKRKTRSKPVKA